jgi:hypothetical protein
MIRVTSGLTIESGMRLGIILEEEECVVPNCTGASAHLSRSAGRLNRAPLPLVRRLPGKDANAYTQ